MYEDEYRLDYGSCLELLRDRLTEPAPARIQLVAGPRQVGKTTLLLELSDGLGAASLYVAADGPEASLPGYWERIWVRAEEVAGREGKAVVLVDEVHLVDGWSAKLKGEWDRIRRLGLPVHVVATGSAALRMGEDTRESLAGRFERVTLTHWSASSLAETFGIEREEAARLFVRIGSYPGSMALRDDVRRWSAYVRDAILEPAIGRDVLALRPVRKPALLRQVFAVCASSPASIVSLQKIQGQLQDRGALETIAHYLRLLEEAFLVAPLDKYTSRPARGRSAPPKLITLNNALLAVVDPRGSPQPATDPARYGAWVENACIGHAWNRGHHVRYWREGPYEVDALLDGSWGSWAIEVKTALRSASELRGLTEFVARHPTYRPLVLCNATGRRVADRAGLESMSWADFLLGGTPGAASPAPRGVQTARGMPSP